MKSIHIFLFLTLTVLSAKAQYPLERSIHPDKEKVNIISYNIFNGFDQKADTDRRTRFVQWVKSQEPEVVAIQELLGMNGEDLKALAAEYGHPYSVILKENGYPVGLTSKKPIEVISRLTENFWHGMLHCRSYEIDFIVTHLSPADWKIRRREAAQIIAYVDSCKLSDYMIMGDLNANSPADADLLETRPELVKRATIEAARNDKYSNYPDGRFDYSVMSAFYAASLIDVCRIYVPADNRHTFPTPILNYLSKDKKYLESIGQRIDFILVSPPLMQYVTYAEIFNGSDTDYLSDHYPIGVSLMLPKTKDNIKP